MIVTPIWNREREEDGEVPLGARYVRGMLLTRADLVRGTMDHPD